MRLELQFIVLCFALILLGLYLIVRSIVRLRHHDQHILEFRRKHSEIAEFVE